jgi:hypothetical protein
MNDSVKPKQSKYSRVTFIRSVMNMSPFSWKMTSSPVWIHLHIYLRATIANVRNSNWPVNKSLSGSIFSGIRSSVLSCRGLLTRRRCDNTPGQLDHPEYKVHLALPLLRACYRTSVLLQLCQAQVALHCRAFRLSEIMETCVEKSARVQMR